MGKVPLEVRNSCHDLRIGLPLGGGQNPLLELVQGLEVVLDGLLLRLLLPLLLLVKVLNELLRELEGLAKLVRHDLLSPLLLRQAASFADLHERVVLGLSLVHVDNFADRIWAGGAG